jgi:hypothetical protein
MTLLAHGTSSFCEIQVIEIQSRFGRHGRYRSGTCQGGCQRGTRCGSPGCSPEWETILWCREIGLLASYTGRTSGTTLAYNTSSADVFRSVEDKRHDDDRILLLMAEVLYR